MREIAGRNDAGSTCPFHKPSNFDRAKEPSVAKNVRLIPNVLKSIGMYYSSDDCVVASIL